MRKNAVLNLSIGDDIAYPPDVSQGVSKSIIINDKHVLIDMTSDALLAVSQSPAPILAELELYFSCLVRKQLRFRELNELVSGKQTHARVIPGFYVSFGAVTTKTCANLTDASVPELEPMPIKHPERFVPDWINIDYRAKQWLGNFGFSRGQR